MPEAIDFEAVIREFKPNAMRDSFDDGRVASYDLTRLELTSPTRLAGCELRIYHDREVPADSPWRRANAAVRFRAVEARVINVKGIVFAGAISDLRVK